MVCCCAAMSIKGSQMYIHGTMGCNNKQSVSCSFWSAIAEEHNKGMWEKKMHQKNKWREANNY